MPPVGTDEEAEVIACRFGPGIQLLKGVKKEQEPPVHSESDDEGKAVEAVTPIAALQQEAGQLADPGEDVE